VPASLQRRRRTFMVRWRRSTEDVAARVLSVRSNCAGVNVGTTVAAPSGPGSSGLTAPLLLTR